MENTECKSLERNSKSIQSIQINLQLSILSCSLSDPPEKFTYKGNDGTVCISEKGQAYIMPHMFQVCLNKCHVCADYIAEGSVCVEGSFFHPSCFCCAECGQVLTGQFYIGSRGEYICSTDYQVLRTGYT